MTCEIHFIHLLNLNRNRLFQTVIENLSLSYSVNYRKPKKCRLGRLH